MKKSKYQHFEEIDSNLFIHYSAMNNSFLLLPKSKHVIYKNSTESELENNYPKLFQNLIEGGFLIESDIDETVLVEQFKNKMLFGKDLYNIVINTTLDCNLACWYCYEKRIENSKLSIETIELIKRNILQRYELSSFKTLKISFFGGEPFMNFAGIQSILNFAKGFCYKKKIELIADFTTNATLITQEAIEYLSQFRCHFQITLDGGRKAHNLIKKSRTETIDTYQRVIDTLFFIDSRISRHWLAIRVNFDNRTLEYIDEIINDISFLDRGKTCVILKKIWQLDTNLVNKNALMMAIQRLFDNNFLVDYYVMPKGCVCFAERESQVLFNYDSKIFKCTTISTFDDENKLGEVNAETGEIIWNKEKKENWFKDMQPEYCKLCHWFPSCLGICNRQLMAHNGEKICTFDAISLTQKEYLIYLFKYHQLQNALYENQ